MTLSRRFHTALILAALPAVLTSLLGVLRPLEGLLPAATGPATSRPQPEVAGRTGRTDRAIEALQTRLRERPEDQAAYVQLGAAYLQKARETGDPSYYARAEGVLRKALALRPDDSEALVAAGTLALARHQFEEALAWGRRAQEQDPDRAAVYGVVGDALIELGRYDEAIAAFQRMVDLRPDLSSYARVSYARELRGDPEGAVAAMQMAASAGRPGTESAAWTRVQLGHLYFNSGNLAAAEAEYQRALQNYPSYVHATAALGRVRAARGDYAGAAALLSRATEVTPLPEYVILLGDVYAAASEAADAGRQYALVEAIDRLQRQNGVVTDLEMALFLADHDLAPAEALARAGEAYRQRPSIHAADVLAWTLYKNGLCAEGLARAQEALRLGTADALMHYHAGMLARCAGDGAQAAGYLERALAMNPYFSLRHAPEARQALDGLPAH
jgi:tetratricopeptide (TPR) repeat protein